MVVAAGGYPGSYNTGDEIYGLPQQEVADGKVFHAGTKLSDDQRVVTNGGRVLCVTALGDSVAQAQQRAYQLLTDIRWDGSLAVAISAGAPSNVKRLTAKFRQQRFARNA
ncbi:phosphoribosylamine--glycine ligase [Klebsiella pneumoniae subsp. ozaenae]|uniref:Glycinamide ribonucleotide synthetase n=1 Tax=Klebsiella pneumoniae subsp. ozaenae TaxID=574 RepID=A0A377YX90_KLEPO|nr:phosphoribosylamine--glycine ligase [Klebsiella pneumoniae subsp. ozaenae]